MSVKNLLRLGLFLLLAALIAIPNNQALAHSGGLNSQGCHAGSQPYHCHRAPSEMVGNRLRCDLGSRSRECLRGPTPSRQSVLVIQQALTRHCNNLGLSFVDGVYGQRTVTALTRFQRAYGLVPDGVYGPRTQAALRGPINGRC